jgi:hypothetical protein
VRIVFVARGDLERMPVTTVNTPRGFVRYSTPEVTALELVGYPHHAGGMNNVATVLGELSEEMGAKKLPKQWVVDCERVGNGEKALIYLGRYLYRGVLAEKNILACKDGQVSFRYTENSGAAKTRTLAGADFLWLLLQHVLPKGFRRTRDYGFLHGNCKRLIQRLHRLLRVCLPKPKEKPSLCCKQCGGVVTLTVIPYPRNRRPPDGPQVTERVMPM